MYLSIPLINHRATSVQAWLDEPGNHRHQRKCRKDTAALFGKPRRDCLSQSAEERRLVQQDHTSTRISPEDVSMVVGEEIFSLQETMPTATHSLEDVLMFMKESSELPSHDSIIFVLQESQKSKSLACAIHTFSCLRVHGLETQSMLGGHLVSMFVVCGSISCAKQVFYILTYRTERSWTSLIQGHAESGDCQVAFSLLQDMQEDGVQPSQFTLVIILRCCATKMLVQKGLDIHSKILKEDHKIDSSVGNALVEMYGRCGFVEDAREVFNKLPSRDVVTWNMLILGYAEQRAADKALLCLKQMQLEGISPDEITFFRILKACSCIEALDGGQFIHSEIVKKGCEGSFIVAKSLVGFYSSCRSLQSAHVITALLPSRDVYLWVTLMAAYGEHGLNSEVLSCKEEMQAEGLCSNTTVFAYCLKACASLKSINHGRQLHVEIEKQGLQGCPIAASALIAMYISCGFLAEAQLVFHGLQVRDTVVWTAMVTGLAEHGLIEEAVNGIKEMHREGVLPDAVTFLCVLKACGAAGAIARGREIHAETVKEGLHDSSFVGNALVHMYAKCGYLVEGEDVFEELSSQDLVSWNTLIDVYVEYGVYEEALLCLEKMEQLGFPADGTTFVCCLKACSCTGDLVKGKEIHLQVVKKGLEKDIFVGSILLDMYCKSGSLAEAQEVFDRLPMRNAVTWSALVSGYVENKNGAQALKCLEQMQLEDIHIDTVTIVCKLKACGSIGSIDKGHEVHSYAIKVGLHCDDFLGSSLVDFYIKCGSLAEAQDVFRSLPARDVVSWSALISGYIELGHSEEALKLYNQMQVEGLLPNAVTLLCVLKACASTGAIEVGQATHVEVMTGGLDTDLYISNTVIDMYAKCGSLEEAFDVFAELFLIRDVVSWSAIITGCVDQGKTDTAYELYLQMMEEGVVQNNVILSSIMKGFGNVCALETGRRLHAQMLLNSETEAMLATALVDMYGRCGSIIDAQQIFDSMPEKDLVAFNVFMIYHARCGDSSRAGSLLQEIKRRPIIPDETTYLSLFTVCNHAGLVSEGQDYFEAMTRDGITPSAVHYDCMIDLLGRAGQLKKAVAMLEDIPLQTDSIAWINMLGACRNVADLDFGTQAFKCAEKLDKMHPAVFVLMSNMYAYSDLEE